MTLKLSQFGPVGELSQLRNPEGYVFRSTTSLREDLMDYTAVRGGVLTKKEVEDFVENFIVMATHPNEIDTAKLPHLFERITYEKYLEMIGGEAE